MIDLIFDTETTGFPYRNSSIDDPRQPHLVQLAVIMAKGDDLMLAWDTIIKCPIDIPEGAYDVHGITTEKSQAEGIDLKEAIGKFDRLLLTADRVVCHNVNFDVKIMSYAYCRADIVNTLMDFSKVCTMKTATPIMKSLGKRWTLQETYRSLVDEAGFEAAHSADADAMACWKVLRALEKRGVELL